MRKWILDFTYFLARYNKPLRNERLCTLCLFMSMLTEKLILLSRTMLSYSRDIFTSYVYTCRPTITFTARVKMEFQFSFNWPVQLNFFSFNLCFFSTVPFRFYGKNCANPLFFANFSAFAYMFQPTFVSMSTNIYIYFFIYLFLYNMDGLTFRKQYTRKLVTPVKHENYCFQKTPKLTETDIKISYQITLFFIAISLET